MIMKRICLFLCLAIFLLSGCASSKKTDINMDQLAKDLVESGSFEDSLAQIDNDAAYKLLGVEFSCDAVVYSGTGATAEELAIFHDSGDKELYAALETHLQERLESYKSYLPDETYKLENAILKSYGDYTILCVAADYDAAQSVIDRYVK